MLRWYRDLIALRRARPELTDPPMLATRVDVDEAARTLLVHRGGVVIAVNLGPAGAATTSAAGCSCTPASSPATTCPEAAEALVLPARSVVVVDTDVSTTADPHARA